MNKFVRFTAIFLAAILFVSSSTSAHADGQIATLEFSGCSNNNANDTLIGETQMVIKVFQISDTQVKFRFENAGPEASSITDVYFDDTPDGPLLGIADLVDADQNDGDPGVDFTQGASPGDLPSGNNCIPPFSATAGFTADSDPPTQPNGVNPGEVLEIIFNLVFGKDINHVIADLTSGALRVGIHVQGYDGGGSESFVSDPTSLTPIELDSFTVKANQGIATINWETATELDNAGFNLYRAASPDGPWVKINAALIEAQDGALTGASYTFVDTPGRGTYYYHLEDIDYYGASTLHEPVLADLGANDP